MWPLKVILLLLPAIAHCGIRLKINAGMTEANTTVEFSGEDISLIKDSEMKSLKIDEESLKKAVKKYLGADCTNAYLKQPTAFGDVYEKYDWIPIKRVVKPIGFKILEIVRKPDVIATGKYINSHATITATYTKGVEKTVEEEFSHTWSNSVALSLGQSISYSIGSVGGSTSLSLSSEWGEEKSESRTVTLKDSSSVSIPVPPGETVYVTLRAESATLNVEIYYEVQLLNGDVFCNYENKLDGYHFVAHPFWSVLKAGNIPKTIKTTETISIGFYTNTELKLE